MPGERSPWVTRRPAQRCRRGGLAGRLRCGAARGRPSPRSARARPVAVEADDGPPVGNSSRASGGSAPAGGVDGGPGRGGPPLLGRHPPWRSATTRSLAAIAPGSWVAMTTALPPAATVRSSCMTSAAVSSSSWPSARRRGSAGARPRRRTPERPLLLATREPGCRHARHLCQPSRSRRPPPASAGADATEPTARCSARRSGAGRPRRSPVAAPSDDPAAVGPALGGAQRGGVAAQDRHVAAAGSVAQGEQGEEGRLAAARRAGQRGDGVLVELGVTAQRVRLAGRRRVDLDQAGDRRSEPERWAKGDGSVFTTEHLHVDCDDAASTMPASAARAARTSHPPAASSTDPGSVRTACGMRPSPGSRSRCASGRSASSASADRAQVRASTTATSSARARAGACRPARLTPTSGRRPATAARAERRRAPPLPADRAEDQPERDLVATCLRRRHVDRGRTLLRQGSVS